MQLGVKAQRSLGLNRGSSRSRVGHAGAVDALGSAVLCYEGLWFPTLSIPR